MTAGPADARARIEALALGDPRAAARFIEEIAPTVWNACRVLTGDAAEAREVFRETLAKLSAENFAIVRSFDGRGTLEEFVALRSRDLLGDRVLRLLRRNRERGWRAFESFFRADLDRLIRRRLPGAAHEDTRRDAYQAISLALVESDCRRLNAYGGQGSFAGFVLRMADRLLIDHLRNANARRRPIEKIAKLATLDGETVEASAEARHLRAEEDAQLAEAADVLARAIPSLSEAEQLYLAILLAHAEPLPAREIARAMQRPVEDIYKMKQRILKRLRDLIAEDAAVKTWRASV